MKTIKDAYKELKGDLKNSYLFDEATDKFLFTDEYDSFVCHTGRDFCNGSKYICTVEEFNNYKGDDVKTITHDNKAYQIGAVYEFTDSDKDRYWELGVLSNYANDAEGVAFQSKVGNKTEWFKRIRLQQTPIGTITEAPIQLEDGKAYQFNARGKTFNGIYEKFHNWLNVMDGQHFDIVACTNIKPLTVEGS